MRGLVIWGFGSAMAFLVTAGAFLVLANLSNTLPARNADPKPAPPKSTPPLKLELSEVRLKELEKSSGQILPLTVKNKSESALSDISLTMRAISEDTTQPGVRYYRATIKNLSAGASKTVQFKLDLSSPESLESRQTPPDSPEPRNILEVQATTPEGISAIKTAVLPP